jgi:hypothetical protein
VSAFKLTKLLTNVNPDKDIDANAVLNMTATVNSG